MAETIFDTIIAPGVANNPAAICPVHGPQPLFRGASFRVRMVQVT